MSARLLDGKSIANQIKLELADEVVEFIESNSVVPKLAAVLVGDDPASQVYVRNKQKACERVGIESQMHRLSRETTQDELLHLVGKLNKANDVHGILIQLPLPDQIDATRVLDAVSPWKDVDAFHPENVGRIAQGRPRFLPCTPHGVQQILHRSEIPVCGKHIVIVGRSDIVGKPLAMMLVQRNSTLGSECANATVTICHSRTSDLAKVTREADVLVAAVGQPKLITAEMVKPGSAVIDVGINRTDEGLVGDVDFTGVREVAGHITPVPGGVGPLTVAMLLRNTLTAAELQIA
ncbi:MAG: bifunctional methylenetetrahydrofolate dehydrogenase/methenyltetrahydrofolate cyclohydrolase FolD [Planctomycetaceae bacterium]|nr:bifunctional methylenetetrahydrofolate dehydrogenase/methenyltetrahydrofolate cyclohydrolase FolD [Planctomycetaceae bacterium]